MLPPEPAVLAGRQGFPDAQALMGGHCAPLGAFQVGWYGTQVSDERGSFAVVNRQGPLVGQVGSFLKVTLGTRSVTVYVIGSYTNLLADLALTRRGYMAISLLAQDPVLALVGVVT